MRPFRVLLLLTVLSLPAVPAPALAGAENDVPEGLTFPPVDEAAKDPDFLAFREGLLASIRARDLAAVAAVADPEIKLSFGGHYGRAGFRDWLAENVAFAGVTYWQELERALELGGVFEAADAFCTPYVFCLEIPGCAACDPYETLVAVTDRAPVFEAPAPDSAVIARLAYKVVRAIDTRNYPWSRISFAMSPMGPAREGFVRPPDFRSPIDYRAFFQRQPDGRWLMTVFIAGD